MVSFSVATPALGFSASSIASAVAHLDMQIEAANTAVTGVVGASWTGAAADAFSAEWSTFLTTARSTREVLLSISTRLYGAQTSYDVTEATLVNASRSSSVRGGAPTAKSAPKEKEKPDAVIVPAGEVVAQEQRSVRSTAFSIDQPSVEDAV